jgi:hypothetical protein
MKITKYAHILKFPSYVKYDSSDMLKANFVNCFNFVCILYFNMAAGTGISKMLLRTVF